MNFIQKLLGVKPKEKIKEMKKPDEHMDDYTCANCGCVYTSDRRNHKFWLTFHNLPCWMEYTEKRIDNLEKKYYRKKV